MNDPSLWIGALVCVSTTVTSPLPMGLLDTESVTRPVMTRVGDGWRWSDSAAGGRPTSTASPRSET